MERAIVLVDAENMASGPLPDERRCLADRYDVRTAVGVTDGDEVIVASSHLAAATVWWAWPAARRLVKSGPDGADLALINAVDLDDVGRRFSRAVIASGDGIFCELAEELISRGVHVVVVAREGSLSRRLAEVASTCIVLPALHDMVLVA